ncbi:hypothetical protein PHO31112_05338 [Pandoraea horticolens]|uniref:Uncharacterized protein n=1 Tax=Pandoraea horticolens TaxID=2508298 RepID=A0A5E4ZCH1_9BURK|nr:hypothetical protein [Pandoraea horticolens]VVE58538.1 hypothetical protein PHO31112_05338 [Pandoraea horticolens]
MQLARDVLATLDTHVDAHDLLSELIGSLPEWRGGHDNGIDELYRSALCAWVAIAPPNDEGRAIVKVKILNMANGNGKLDLRRLGLECLPELPERVSRRAAGTACKPHRA